MNLILQAIKSLFRKLENKFRKLENKIEKDIINNRSDWEQNDENGDGYIKNRPFYHEKDAEIDILPVGNYQTDDYDGAMVYYLFEGQLIAGAKYIVTFNDLVETRFAVANQYGGVYLESSNNTDLGVENWNASDIRFFSWDAQGGDVHRLGLTLIADEIKQIDEKFIPDSLKHSIDENTRNLLTYQENSHDLPDTFTGGKIVYVNDKFIILPSSKNTTIGIRYSYDGFTWHSSTLPTYAKWNSIAYGNGKFIAVATGTIAACSEDGITWELLNLPASSAWNSIAYGNGKFVIVNTNNIGKICVGDGTNWRTSTIPVSQNILSIIYGNGKFVVMGSGIEKSTGNNVQQIVSFSEDGINWTEETTAVGFPTRYGSALSYCNGKYFITATTTSTISYASFFYSDDCINWVASDYKNLNSWSKVAYGGGKFVSVCRGDRSTLFAYSEDGINWRSISRGSFSEVNWNTIVYGNGIFICISNPPNDVNANKRTRLLYSRDGIHWSSNDINIIQDGERKNDNIRSLLLDGYTLPSPSTARVGQTFRVSEVNGYGEVTAIEAVDEPYEECLVKHPLPYVYLTDSVNGKTYKLEMQDGTLTSQEVVQDE